MIRINNRIGYVVDMFTTAYAGIDKNVCDVSYDIL